jgi:hypothetical protein
VIVLKVSNSFFCFSSRHFRTHFVFWKMIKIYDLRANAKCARFSDRFLRACRCVHGCVKVHAEFECTSHQITLTEWRLMASFFDFSWHTTWNCNRFARDLTCTTELWTTAEIFPSFFSLFSDPIFPLLNSVSYQLGHRNFVDKNKSLQIQPKLNTLVVFASHSSHQFQDTRL